MRPVGFIVKKFVTMHGHMNIKWPTYDSICVWKHSVVLHNNYDSHNNVSQDDGLLWQGDTQLGTMCRTNVLPPSPDCSLLDREITFFHPYQFTEHHIFVRTGFLGFTNADQGISPLQQLTQKGGTFRIQYKSVIVNDLVATKYKNFKNQFQATAVKSNR